MDRISMGDLGDESSAERSGRGDDRGSSEPGVIEDVGLEPPPLEFVLDLPNISSIDLSVV
jgi:hypothetical protein